MFVIVPSGIMCKSWVIRCKMYININTSIVTIYVSAYILTNGAFIMIIIKHNKKIYLIFFFCMTNLESFARYKNKIVNHNDRYESFYNVR